LNTKIQTFPSNLIAGMFGFKIKEFFELEAAEQEKAEKPVDVKF
jgi:LemA protein